MWPHPSARAWVSSRSRAVQHGPGLEIPMRRMLGGSTGTLGMAVAAVFAASLASCSGGDGKGSTATEAAAAPAPTLTATLTREAAQEIARLMRDRRIEGSWYVRIGTADNNPEVKQTYRGYVLDLTQTLKPGDVWADSEGFRLIAQPKDAEALSGHVIDHTTRGKIAGFVFMEP